MFSLPIYWIGFYFFVFAFVVWEALGSIFLGQIWTNAALENSTQAGAAQLNLDGNASDVTGQALQNQADAQNVAEKTWEINQSLNPYVAKSSATFSATANSVTGTATVPINENPINNFINNFHGGQKANFGGSLTDTVKSTLPSSPTSTLPTLGSSLPTNTLPSLGSSLPSTTLP